MDYAIPRPNWTPGGDDADLEDWMTQRYQSDPTYQIPNGYSLKDGRVVRDQPSFLLRHPWLIPVLAMGGAGGLTAAGLGGGSGAAASGAGGVGIGETGAVTGLGGSGFGGGSAGALTGAGLGSRLATAAGQAGIMALGQRFGARGMEIPPEVRQLLELQRQQAEMQTERMKMQGPLYQSILQMAMSRLPTNMQTASPAPAPAAQQQAVQFLAGQRRR